MVWLNVFVLHIHGDFALKDWSLVQPPASPVFFTNKKEQIFTVVSYLHSPGCPLIIAVSSV